MLNSYYDYLVVTDSKNIFQLLKELFKKLKPVFCDRMSFVVFGISYIVLMSPAIVGYILGLIFEVKGAVAFATGYIILTSTTSLPVPIIPVCFGSVAIYRRIKKNKELKGNK